MSKDTLEQLLAKAENKKKQRRSENNASSIKYFENMGWTAGLNRVPTYVIYWHYRAVYDGCHNDTKAKKVTFFRTMSKRFPKDRGKLQRYYLLNFSEILPQYLDESGSIKQEILEKAKAYDKNHGQRRRKKKTEVQLPGQEGHYEN